MKYLNEFFQNRILMAAIVSWFIAQGIKIILDLRRNRKVDLRLITSSGGMPSSHTSSVVALTIAIGLTEGFNTVFFAISLVFSMVIMYDAAGVRRAAGQQAEVINMLVTNLENSGIKLDKELKELLGHSPIEVFAGALLGIIVGILFCLN